MKARSSVRWRLVLIYFTLVFIAMTIVTVFLLDRIEDYQLSSLKENITATVEESNLLGYLSSYENLADYADDIQTTINTSWTNGFAQELSVVDINLAIIGSTNNNIKRKSVTDIFDADVIIQAIQSKKLCSSLSESGELPIQNLAFPICAKTGDVTGVVYIRSDISSINSFVADSRTIFIQASFFALVATVILGFLLARSITVPIRSVTESVSKMSQGDFSITVPVKSNDEIGQLAEMFNLLRDKLDETIIEIDNEKNKLGTILEYMADGLLAMDLNGRIIHINPTARKFLKLNKTIDLIGSEYSDILGNRDPQLALDFIKEQLETGGVLVNYRQEDETYVVHFDYFKDESGKDIGIIVLMQDVTDRQKLEDMQTDFVANVSHELKTPLTNIKSYTETLLDGAINDKEMAVNFLQIVDREADRMNHLVKDLLQLSRLDHKQEHMNFKESNIVVIVNMAIMEVEMTAKQKGLALETLYDIESDIRTEVDRDRIEQVILNVLSNAIKYTNAGGVYVDIKEENGFVNISVTDTGVGIPKEALPRIYERFYRVDKARSRAMGGTGLGLAITRQIVDEHGGTITAESEEGKGTRVTISLPLAIKKGVRGIE